MTKVNHLASRSAGNPVRMSARNPAEVLTPDQQATIESALSMALYFIRQCHATPANMWAATARTNRALTLLKQANENSGNQIGRV